MGHSAPVHAAASRAAAEVQLAILAGWPQSPRCRSGAYIGGPTCHQGREHPAGAAAEDEPAEVALRALPLEVWAAQRRT